MSAYRRYVAIFVTLGHLLVTSLGFVSLPAAAQSIDGEPPTIEFERIAEGVRGDTQVFSANVSDGVQVEAVTLHYRLGNSDAYSTLPMEVLTGTDIYTASVETAGSDADVLQYYIEARDGAGNRSIQGFAFDPIERVLTDGSAPLLTEAEAAPVTTPITTRRKVLYGVLGLVAVGALAAVAGGGGSSGGDSPQADEPRVPLDIIVDPL